MKSMIASRCFPRLHFGAVPVAAAVVVGVLFGWAPVVAADIPDWAVTTTGIGEMETVPDLASFEAATVAIADTADAAKNAAATTARSVLSALAGEGVAAEDVQTSTIALAPVFSRRDATDPSQPSQELSITGYRARISHRITVRELADLGKVVDAAVAAGAQEINSVGFGVADTAALENEALRKAIADARRMAEIVAKEGDFRLGPIISATVIEDRGGPMPARLMAAEAGSMPIQPGRVAVRMRVRVLFAIDDMPDDLMKPSPTAAPRQNGPAQVAPRASAPRTPAAQPVAAPAARPKAPAPGDLFVLPDTPGAKPAPASDSRDLFEIR